MKKTLMAAVLASSAVALAAPAHADHDPASSGNHWGTAAPVVCTAENTVKPVLGDLASAPTHACPEG